jgi:hypothetical protein
VSRRLVIAGVASAAVVGAVVPSFAQTGPASPVTVHTDTHNGIAVGVDVAGNPGVAASVTPDGKVCVGVSLQVPVCTPGGIIGGVGRSAPTQPLPVVIRHDDNGTAVGVGRVGVIIEKDGTICPVVSTQAWQCIPAS